MDKPVYSITVTSLGGRRRMNGVVLRAAVRGALRHRGIRRARVNVTVVDDVLMARLHARHLDREGPTDVLSFNLRDPGDSLEADGEVVISLETAAREASLRGHSTEAEASLYAVHGVLHLLGDQDRRPADRAAMHETEDAILTELGWGAVYARRRKPSLNRSRRPAAARRVNGR